MSGLIRPYEGTLPTLGSSAFVAETATVIGDVHIGEKSGIWHGCVVRGDVNHIRIGSETNIQDGTVVHVTRVTQPTLIGDRVTIGHMALLHGCVVEDLSFIGMRATIMDGVVVESGSMVAAGALVTPNKRVKSGQLWAGSPAKYMRDLTLQETEFLSISAQNYVRLAAEYQAEPS